MAKVSQIRAFDGNTYELSDSSAGTGLVVTEDKKLQLTNSDGTALSEIDFPSSGTSVVEKVWWPSGAPDKEYDKLYIGSNLEVKEDEYYGGNVLSAKFSGGNGLQFISDYDANNLKLLNGSDSISSVSIPVTHCLEAQWVSYKDVNGVRVYDGATIVARGYIPREGDIIRIINENPAGAAYASVHDMDDYQGTSDRMAIHLDIESRQGETLSLRLSVNYNWYLIITAVGTTAVTAKILYNAYIDRQGYIAVTANDSIDQAMANLVKYMGITQSPNNTTILTPRNQSDQIINRAGEQEVYGQGFAYVVCTFDEVVTDLALFDLEYVFDSKNMLIPTQVQTINSNSIPTTHAVYWDTTTNRWKLTNPPSDCKVLIVRYTI